MKVFTEKSKAFLQSLKTIYLGIFPVMESGIFPKKGMNPSKDGEHITIMFRPSLEELIKFINLGITQVHFSFVSYGISDTNEGWGVSVPRKIQDFMSCKQPHITTGHMGQPYLTDNCRFLPLETFSKGWKNRKKITLPEFRNGIKGDTLLIPKCLGIEPETKYMGTIKLVTPSGIIPLRDICQQIKSMPEEQQAMADFLKAKAEAEIKAEAEASKKREESLLLRKKEAERKLTEARKNFPHISYTKFVDVHNVDGGDYTLDMITIPLEVYSKWLENMQGKIMFEGYNFSFEAYNELFKLAGTFSIPEDAERYTQGTWEEDDELPSH